MNVKSLCIEMLKPLYSLQCNVEFRTILDLESYEIIFYTEASRPCGRQWPKTERPSNKPGNDILFK